MEEIRLPQKLDKALTNPLRSSGANTALKHVLLWSEMSCSVQARHAGCSRKDMTLGELGLLGSQQATVCLLLGFAVPSLLSL